MRAVSIILIVFEKGTAAIISSERNVIVPKPATVADIDVVAVEDASKRAVRISPIP
jgi:hypothetical protein